MPAEDFLPTEYVEHQADRRTHAFGLTLFGVVVAVVAIAFLAKQRDWERVQQVRDEITARYEEAGEQVEVISSLQERQRRIHDRATVAAGLVEMIPRSTLLATFINRMPAGLGLLEFDLHTHKVQAPKPPGADAATSRRAARAEAASVPDAPTAARYRTDITLLGFAPTDLQVSAFLAELNAHPHLHDVVLQFSEHVEMDAVPVRQFRMTCSLGPDADLRSHPSGMFAEVNQ